MTNRQGTGIFPEFRVVFVVLYAWNSAKVKTNSEKFRLPQYYQNPFPRTSYQHMSLSYSVPSVSSGGEDIGAAEAVPEILAAVAEPGGEGGAQQQLRCRHLQGAHHQ